MFCSCISALFSDSIKMPENCGIHFSVSKNLKTNPEPKKKIPAENAAIMPKRTFSRKVCAVTDLDRLILYIKWVLQIVSTEIATLLLPFSFASLEMYVFTRLFQYFASIFYFIFSVIFPLCFGRCVFASQNKSHYLTRSPTEPNGLSNENVHPNKIK